MWWNTTFTPTLHVGEKSLEGPFTQDSVDTVYLSYVNCLKNLPSFQHRQIVRHHETAVGKGTLYVQYNLKDGIDGFTMAGSCMYMINYWYTKDIFEILFIFS